MNTSANFFFVRIAVSRARSFLAYLARYVSSFAARLIAVPARHGGSMAWVRERGAAGLPAPNANASPCPACHPEKMNFLRCS
jgi:hypothetical protein